jgi:hypothetical protein
MLISAVGSRRKATTYGKTSRRQMITAGNAFAQAAGTDLLHAQDDLMDWDQTSTTASRRSKGAIRSHVGRESSAGRGIPMSTKLKEQNHLVFSTATYVVEDKAVYDLPSSENDQKQDPVGAKTGSRKRRKISPVPYAGNGPLVYDDAGLQSHIAAESHLDLTLPRSCSMKLVLGDQGRPSCTVGDADGEKRSSTPEKQDSLPDDRRIASVDKATKEAESVAARRVKHPKSSTSPRKEIYTSDSVAQIGVKSTTSKASPTIPALKTHPSSPPTSRVGLHKKPSSSPERFRPPTTPPRLINDTEEITTPRQRQLWNKLLVEDFQIASPSTQNMPRPTSAHQKFKVCKQPATAGNSMRDGTKGSALTSCSRKVVDNLHLGDHDQNSLSDDSKDDSNSTCSDSLSNHTDSDALALTGAITVQTSPSADSQSRIKPSHVHPVSNTSEPVPSLLGVGLKVTYARQRSFLTDNNLDDAAMLRLSLEPEPTSLQGVGRNRLVQQLPKSHSMQSLEDDIGDSQDSQGGAMRSIHELREAGGNVRLVSELEAILDDIEDEKSPSHALRRTRLLDLVAKLQEPSNCRLFIDQGLETRLLAYAGIETDRISKSLLAAAILEFIAGPISALLLSQISDTRVVDFLVNLLELDQDLLSEAKLRGYNLSRYVQQKYTKVCTSISQSAAWRPRKPTVLTCHVLALQCLEYLVRHIRESGSSSAIFPAYAIRRIVACSILPASVLLPQLTPAMAINLELTVSILESCTISNTADCQESLWEGETLQQVLSLLPLLLLWREEECATSRTLTLRLYCNLTNKSPELCEDFSTPEIAEALLKLIVVNFEQLSEQSVKQQQPMLSDTLILSLGIFVNLAESSTVIRQMVMVLQYRAQNYLDVLVELFMTKSKNAAEVRDLYTVWDRYTDFH